jgi:hypothetical protein
VLHSPGRFTWFYVDLVDDRGRGATLIWSWGLPFLPGYAQASRAGRPELPINRPSVNLVVYEPPAVPVGRAARQPAAVLAATVVSEVPALAPTSKGIGGVGGTGGAGVSQGGAGGDGGYALVPTTTPMAGRAVRVASRAPGPVARVVPVASPRPLQLLWLVRAVPAADPPQAAVARVVAAAVALPS